MKRNEFIKVVAKSFGIDTLKEAEEKLRVFEGDILDILKDGESFSLASIVFETKEKKATSGVSGMNGEAVKWSKPAHIAPKVKFGKRVKDAVYKEL